MGTGTKHPAIDPAIGSAIDNMKDQLLIVLIKRLGGIVEIPVSEVDATGGDLVTMEIDQIGRTFTFSHGRKQ